MSEHGAEGYKHKSERGGLEEQYPTEPSDTAPPRNPGQGDVKPHVLLTDGAGLPRFDNGGDIGDTSLENQHDPLPFEGESQARLHSMADRGRHFFRFAMEKAGVAYKTARGRVHEKRLDISPTTETVVAAGTVAVTALSLRRRLHRRQSSSRHRIPHLHLPNRRGHKARTSRVRAPFGR
jgi:hypothetical protein